MELDFLRAHYPNRRITIRTNEHGHAFAEIETEGEPVTVWYDAEDPQPYMVCFAYQHIHCFNEEDALEWTEEFLSGEKSAIEFFVGNRPIVGGDIDSVAPEDFTEDYFKTCPFAAYILSRPIPFGLHFKVRSVLKKFCFEGRIEKKGEKINFVIHPIT